MPASEPAVVSIDSFATPTIITRAGEGTKIILTGDPYQIDHPYLDSSNNGLTTVAERFKLEAIAGELAEDVRIPVGTTCCGMAGDRGLLHPELPASALRDGAAELAEHPTGECLCSNRTCEIALQQVTGASYASFVLLLERLTRP